MLVFSVWSIFSVWNLKSENVTSSDYFCNGLPLHYIVANWHGDLPFDHCFDNRYYHVSSYLFYTFLTDIFFVQLGYG